MQLITFIREFFIGVVFNLKEVLFTCSKPKLPFL